MFCIKSKIKYIFPVIFLSIILVVLGKDYFFQATNHENFKQIDKYAEVEKVFNSCDRNTLVTFDVDDTLITATDVVANLELPLWFKIRSLIRYPELLTNENKMEFIISLVFQQAKRYVFDPDIVHFIQQIEQQGSIVVGLTSMESSGYGVIKSMPEWRFDMLKDMDITFNTTFSDVYFNKLPLYRDQHPLFYKGILCANQTLKGAVLAAFLDYYKLTPTRIISFDDDLSALNSISKVCAQRKILFIGYQILGAKKLYSQWSTKRALLQLDNLMHNATWLSDKEADNLSLKNHSS